MYWKNSVIWLTVFFIASLVIIGMCQNSFHPSKIAVSQSSLILDFMDQKLRVTGWNRNYAAITVKKYNAPIDYRKKHFAIIRYQNGQIILEKIKKTDFYIIDSWLTLHIFKQYQSRFDVSNVIELNDKNIFTIQVPRNARVVIRGKLLKATGCIVTKI